MKTLYLLRHAKSSWDDDQLDDKDRPLTKRGKRDCELVIQELERLNRIPRLIHCSTARRAQETLKKLKQSSALIDQTPATDSDALYTFEKKELLDYLKDLPNDADQLMIIGHNPALLDLANYLYDGNISTMGTCTFTELALNVEYWDQLRGDCAKLVEVIRPKQLR
ncbi:histidine phosphatase family protein [Spongiibacter sp. KMU-158]|uniref:Histidine phosphatase family protein n=1 Tax=Spongiibacter pelagi TaxID=2760804 RepID=A0A927C4H6_9GAMM|nr:histidine phosphatase family protein [Spongiibacter pelagi]MBD2859285.1 histidine phosphatase family protein [Spongiibacter pelagi]